MKHNNIRVPKDKRNQEIEKLFEEIMTKNFRKW